MDALRRRLGTVSWSLFGVLTAAFLALRGRLPEHLASGVGPEGEILSWAGRDAFFAVQIGVLALILLFTALIDRVLLRRYGDTAFIAAVALFMAILSAATLAPVLLAGLGVTWVAEASWGIVAAGVAGLAGAYVARMRTLRLEGVAEAGRDGYYGRIRPGWFFALLPPAYPFLPFSVSADAEGLRVKGPLMDCRWGWASVVSVRPGRRSQAYGGMAVRLTASGFDVVVVEVRGQRWPVVLNAPDRDAFLAAVRRLAPQVRIAGPDSEAAE